MEVTAIGIVMEGNELQPLKTYVSMLFTFFPICISVKHEQPEKVHVGIVVIPVPILTAVIFEQF